MHRRSLHPSAALVGALALVMATPTLAAQAKVAKPAKAPAGVAAATPVPMPRSDRMPMAYFKDLLKKGEVVVLDVRSIDSYSTGHIPGALSMPEETLTPAVAEKLKRMGKPIATYCS